jgi:hypothetical protein
MSPAGFEPAIPASERPQIHAWDRAASGIGEYSNYYTKNIVVAGLWSWNLELVHKFLTVLLILQRLADNNSVTWVTNTLTFLIESQQLKFQIDRWTATHWRPVRLSHIRKPATFLSYRDFLPRLICFLLNISLSTPLANLLTFVLIKEITTMIITIIHFFTITPVLSSQRKISCFHNGEDSYCGFLGYDTV